jgi:hypothetical protein
LGPLEQIKYEESLNNQMDQTIPKESKLDIDLGNIKRIAVTKSSLGVRPVEKDTIRKIQAGNPKLRKSKKRKIQRRT